MGDRMPMLLSQDTEKIWLDESVEETDLILLLKPLDSHQMTAYTVSPKVNNLANDSPDLLIPVPPADQFGNYTLFE